MNQLALIVGLLLIAGCTAVTDPATGKRFDPAKAQVIVTDPAVQAGASAVPYGLGSLGLAVIGAGLMAYNNRKHAETSKALADVVTHSITTAAETAAATIATTAAAPQIQPVATLGLEPTTK